MGLVRKQRKGEGMHILGKGKDIEITILEIGGEEFHRRVKFEVKGLEHIKGPLDISSDQNYVNITPDIKIRVSNGTDWKEDIKGSSVFVDYHAPKADYKMDRRESSERRPKDPDGQPPWIVNENHPVGYYYRQDFKNTGRRK